MVKPALGELERVQNVLNGGLLIALLKKKLLRGLCNAASLLLAATHRKAPPLGSFPSNYNTLFPPGKAPFHLDKAPRRIIMEGRVCARP